MKELLPRRGRSFINAAIGLGAPPLPAHARLMNSFKELVKLMKLAAPVAALVVLPFLSVATPGFAVDARIARQLEALDPDTRLEQACDTEAMARISAGKGGFKADKVIAYTFAEPERQGDSLSAPGAVFRSRGEWYRLSFSCLTGPKRINVRSFDYEVGSIVPHDEWTQNYLYD